MAKITLKSFDEFIVQEEKAKLLLELLEEKKLGENSGGLSLSSWPITIEHQDGLWCGSLANISQISLSEKYKTHQYKFKSEEDLLKFHKEYGYGAFSNYHLQGYGVVDVQTQFLIKAGLSKIVNNNIIMLSSPNEEKWKDLWSIYLSRLDPFYEL